MAIKLDKWLMTERHLTQY